MGAAAVGAVQGAALGGWSYGPVHPRNDRTMSVGSRYGAVGANAAVVCAVFGRVDRC